MISRIWHGWTTPANADAYEALLVTTIIPSITARKIRGYAGIRVDRRNAGDEVEFVTTMFFDSQDAIREFAGPTSFESVVPPSARALLAHFDAHSTHYRVIVESR